MVCMNLNPIKIYIKPKKIKKKVWKYLILLINLIHFCALARYALESAGIVEKFECIGSRFTKRRCLFVSLTVCDSWFDFVFIIKYFSFSFALILYEIILRKNPFEEINMSNNEILHRIINPKLYGEVFRPKLKKLKCSTYIIKCVNYKSNPEYCFNDKFISI